MKDKIDRSKRFHETIKTKHVFIEDNQVFLKRDTRESVLSDDHGEIWCPINFQWVPVVALKKAMK